MIKSVTVTNEYGESIVLKLSDPWDTGLAITGIEGLGPNKASINTTEIATTDGALYNSAKIPSRNIVFNFRLLGDPETQLVEDTRLKTYKYFPLKKEIKMTFETDRRITEITGVVESNEPSIFSKEESTKISVICPNPYFKSYSKDINLNGVEDEFEFPFSNESLTEDLICMGEVVYSVGTNFYYDGDADAGVVVNIHVNGPCANLSVYNLVTKESMFIDTSKIRSVVGGSIDDLVAGDTVELSTLSGVGKKYIYLYRDGERYNILPTLPKIPHWLTVRKGDNVFGYSADVGQANVEIAIQTTILYEGV